MMAANGKSEAKRKIKDSVFTDLFQDTKYVLKLYQALHPEDTEVTEENISNVTLKNVLLDQMYNDLGFQIGNRLVVLVEAQSTWTPNILIRSLMYLAQTWQEYIESTGQNVYGSRKIELPEPELYVIYTGDRKSHPNHMLLTEDFFGNHHSAIEVKVKMIYDGKEGDIINQYVGFTRVYNEQVRQYGRTRQAVMETIRICRDRNYLKEYLEAREKEVVNIMMTLFDDEYIYKTYVESEKKEAAQKAAQEATRRANVKTARSLYESGVGLDVIAHAVGQPTKTVKEWLGLASV